MRFRPSLASLVASTGFALLPLALGVCTTYFVGTRSSLLIWLATGAMALLSLCLVLQTVFVHLTSLYLDDTGIVVVGPIARFGIRWTDASTAVLRERVNAVSRTDRLLLIDGANRRVLYNVSVLSRQDEQRVLDFVRARTPLVVRRDGASV